MRGRGGDEERGRQEVIKSVKQNNKNKNIFNR